MQCCCILLQRPGHGWPFDISIHTIMKAIQLVATTLRPRAEVSRRRQRHFTVGWPVPLRAYRPTTQTTLSCFLVPIARASRTHTAVSMLQVPGPPALWPVTCCPDSPRNALSWNSWRALLSMAIGADRPGCVVSGTRLRGRVARGHLLWYAWGFLTLRSKYAVQIWWLLLSVQQWSATMPFLGPG